MTSVGVTDNKIQRLQQEIIRKQNFLTQQMATLGKRSNLNQFLQIVNSDYQRNLATMLEQQQDKQKALENLQTYLDSINRISNNVNTSNTDLIQQQQRVQNELLAVKNKINELTRQINGN
jgi:DNA repair exonuclease SbcCD ATPase subunit